MNWSVLDGGFWGNLFFGELGFFGWDESGVLMCYGE